MLPGQVTEGPGVQAETPTQPSEQPTAAAVAVQPAATPALESSVPLLLSSYSGNHTEIHRVDPATGQNVPGYAPIALGEDSMYASPSAVSGDGQKLAIHAPKGQSCETSVGGYACWGGAGVLHLIDLQAWSEVTATLPGGGWVDRLAINPDTTRLALVYNERNSTTLMVLDTESGKIVTQQELELRPSLIGYVQDGATLAVYGQPPGSNPGMTQPDPPRVLILDPTTLEVRWDQSLENVLSGHWCLENCEASHEKLLFADWSPAVVFSHDGRKLYVVHADEERLTTVDLDARAVHTVEIQVAQSWFERLLALTAGVAEAKSGSQGASKTAALSPDGTRLYVVGYTTEAMRDADGYWQTTEGGLPRPSGD